MFRHRGDSYTFLPVLAIFESCLVMRPFKSQSIAPRKIQYFSSINTESTPLPCWHTVGSLEKKGKMSADDGPGRK
jgi:hypothetical protein